MERRRHYRRGRAHRNSTAEPNARCVRCGRTRRPRSMPRPCTARFAATSRAVRNSDLQTEAEPNGIWKSLDCLQLQFACAHYTVKSIATDGRAKMRAAEGTERGAQRERRGARRIIPQRRRTELTHAHLGHSRSHPPCYDWRESHGAPAGCTVLLRSSRLHAAQLGRSEDPLRPSRAPPSPDLQHAKPAHQSRTSRLRTMILQLRPVSRRRSMRLRTARCLTPFHPRAQTPATTRSRSPHRVPRQLCLGD